MAGDQPFLRFDAGALNAITKESFDATDFAALWAPITKCKHRLSDGHRLENLTWRLWIRETNLSRGRGPRCRPGSRPHSTAARRLISSASTVHGELSDPEAGGSVTSASDEEDDGHDRPGSSSSLDAARNRFFGTATSDATARASSNDTSIPSEDERATSTKKAPGPLRPSGTFLPLLPSESATPAPARLGVTASASALEPARHHRAPSAHSLPAFSIASGAPSPILPPARPNALTPSGLANIIQTMMPMDFAAEHAKARCLALSEEVEKLVPMVAVAMTKEEGGGSKSEGESGATPSKRWTAPEPGVLSQLVSAEATPVGTPVKQQQLKAPRIVNIAPTPPSKSPSASREGSPKEAGVEAPSRAGEIPASDLQATVSSATSGSSSSTTPSVESPTTPAAQAGSSRSAAGGPLRPALAKRGSTAKTVRISPPHTVKGAAMERRASNGSTRTSSTRSSGRSSLLAVSAASTSAGGRSKGKGRTEAVGRPRSYRKGSGASSVLATVGSSTVGGGSGSALGSPLGLRRNSSSLCTMVDALPEYKAPQRTVRGFDPQSVSVNTTAAQQAATAATEATIGSVGLSQSPSVVPATPANSNASRSEASSASTSYPSGFPEAPPPTPAKQGAPLPTTMTARSTIEGGIDVAQKQREQLQQQRAKFFIDSHVDTDDEASLSPRSSKSGGSFRRRFVPVADSPAMPPAPPPSLASERPAVVPVQRQAAPPPPHRRTVSTSAAPVEEVVEDDEDDEFETESEDSEDEWGSEFTDSEAEEEAREVERREKQAAFQRELFAKHDIRRNPSTIDEGAGADAGGAGGGGPQVKRAGLSMLFHPELRNPAAAGAAPMRNQSAVELRPPPANPAKSSKSPSLNQTRQQQQQQQQRERGPPVNRSFSNFRSPMQNGILKSKSSVALPAITQGEPVMKTRTPSTGGSSRSWERLTTASRTSAPKQPPPVPPAMGRQPSRLGARPADTEYSDDDDSDDEEEDRPSKEQDERLAAVAARTELAQRNAPPGPLPMQATEPTAAQPLSPRTTRRNMIANEMTESVRRNLLWERQMRAHAMGMGTGRTQPVRRDEELAENDFITRGFHEAGW